MKAESFIKKIRPDPDGLDFEGLREEGVKLVQETSGDLWTDFNLHDPGVTILEALCYALTDLVYRTSFGAADYLASSDGAIDFNKQVLYRPDEIFSCRPVTDSDYRKLILNAVPNTDNVWIKRNKVQTDEPDGLYKIYVQLSERVKSQGNEGIRKTYSNAIAKVYAANRNLCEDLAEIEIVERIPYILRGEIDIEGNNEPANILAEIYFECAQYLSPKVSIHSYAEMYKGGSSLEALFTGTLTDHGYIEEEGLHPWCGHFAIPELIGKLSRIEGVKNIKHLVFVDADGNETEGINLGEDRSHLFIACLRFPLPEGEDGIKLYKNGKANLVSPHDVETEYGRLEFNHQALRQQKPRFDWVEAMLPKGTFRNTSEYYSFQNHFPDVYGLNAYGVPDSAPPERKAQAMQLKAYLLFFEQIMANFLQNVQEIPRLFSLDEQLRVSYFYQILRNDALPRVEEIYRPDVAQMGAELAKLLAGFDNFGDRRNRVLDYLLGLYGEKFSQNSLRHFFAAGTDADEERVRNKIAFLKEAVDLGKNRGGAFDYRKPSNDNQNSSGLKKKLKILLGFMPDGNAPLPDAYSEPDQDGEDLQIVEHVLLRPTGNSTHEGHKVPDDFYSFRISIIFPAQPVRFANGDFRKLAEETVFLNCPAHIFPEIFWLEPERMRKFETLHGEWLETKRVSGAGSENGNAAALRLILFLLEIRQRKCE